ncbi:MAG: aspartate 1-decarboxylase [Planctomycetes bacterium]|nr:aspartate 1-decarboxylase [Planctomycetota bacterium]
MLREMCKSKIHGATVTGTKLHYSGSVQIDRAVLDAANILPYEKVQIVNLNNGSRIDTYAIPAKRKSGTFCLLGPAARTAQVGDRVHVLCYALAEEDKAANWMCSVVTLDEKNRIAKRK